MLYWDESLQEWVEDPEEVSAEAPPPFMPPTNRYESRSVGPPEGRRTSKGEIAQLLLDEEAKRKAIPQRPTLLNGVSYEDQPGVPPRGSVEPAEIVGYGKRLMLHKGGDSNWLNVGGEEASPEYVQDIQDTMRQLDSGEMSETQLKEKIKSQEGKPPGKKPTDVDMTLTDYLKINREAITEEARGIAKERVSAFKSKIPYTTQALTKDFDLKMADLEERYFENTYKKITDAHTYDFKERYKKEEEERKNLRELNEKKAFDAQKAADKAEADLIKSTEKKEKEAEKKLEKDRVKFTELSALRKAVVEATTDESGKPKDPNPDVLEPLLEMADRAGFELKKTTGKPVERGIPGIGYKQFFGEKESDRWQLVPKSKNEKTVEIEGKKYKDGDIVTQNGKKFRVKVK